MHAFLQSMALPFLACLVLTGIHVYLGIHVLARKVIFVDLALATIAALGAVCGALLGWDVHEDVWAIKGFSLAFTIVGAAVFSLTRVRHDRVPQEAIIGITYAVALAAIILGSARLPHGAEEVRELQAGSILWVSGSTIAASAALYALVGLFHWVFRGKFLAISRDPERAASEGLNVRLWDFLFYVSFGFVVTSSVSIAGVLLVFSYLVIPSVVAMLFAEGIGARLAIGWTVGTLVSATGVALSYNADLPSGPVIVVCFGACLALAGVAHHVLHAGQRLQATLRVAGMVLVLLLLARGSLFLRKGADLDLAHVLETGTKSERLVVLNRVAAQPELWPQVAELVPGLLRPDRADIEVRLALLELVEHRHATELASEVAALLSDPDDVVREQAVRVVRALQSSAALEALRAAAASEEDEHIKVEIGESLLELGDASGIPVFLDVMEHGQARQARRDALEHLQAHAKVSLPYHPEADAATRASQVAAFRTWWADDPEVLLAPASR